MNNYDRLQKHPLYLGHFFFHDRYCVRVKTPGQRLASRVVPGDTLEEAAGLALITMRITK